MIELYIRDIRCALAGKCYFSALSLSLALPDICGMVEYPNATVTERYIRWYDAFIAAQTGGRDATPGLTGEVVYNLRNTFLHQGAPTIDAGKVKEERNQLDRFKLFLGDGSKLHFISQTVEMKNVAVRMLMVDVTWLCTMIADAALAYYLNHRDAFAFDYNVIPPQALFGPQSPPDAVSRDEDPLGDMLKDKLGEDGRHLVFQDNITRVISDKSAEAITKATVSKSKASLPNKPALREGEHRLRCFFGKHFKEQKYRAHRDEIIDAVLSAKTKTQLNNNLMKLFPGADVKNIYVRLKPLIQEWPGQ